MKAFLEFFNAALWLAFLAAVASAILGLTLGFCWGLGGVFFNAGRAVWS